MATQSHYQIVLLGFSAFEREALSSYFRLATNRQPHYVQVLQPNDAQLVVADGAHPPSVNLVQATERLDETLFIGGPRPAGALAWLPRPIDTLHVLRELDVLATRCFGGASAGGRANDAHEGTGAVRTVIQAARGAAPEPAVPAFGAGTGLALGADMAGDDGDVIDLSRLDPPDPSDRFDGEPAAPTMPIPLMPFAPTMPADLASPASLAYSAPPAAPPIAPPWRGNPRLATTALLVDDSDVALRFLQGKLERYGLVVTCATTSQQARELLLRQPFDLIFLDMELGPASAQDGIGLCQQIKRSARMPAPMSLVMVSAHHGETERARGALAGCDAFLGKPLDDADLRRLMESHGIKPLQTAALHG